MAAPRIRRLRGVPKATIRQTEVGRPRQLIVYGRVNHRSRWGDWIAVAGFALLVLAGVLALLSGR